MFFETISINPPFSAASGKTMEPCRLPRGKRQIPRSIGRRNTAAFGEIPSGVSKKFSRALTRSNTKKEEGSTSDLRKNSRADPRQTAALPPALLLCPPPCYPGLYRQVCSGTLDILYHLEYMSRGIFPKERNFKEIRQSRSALSGRERRIRLRV
jgi:hypothetical protein